MENTMTVSQPTETQMSHPVVPTVPDVSLDPMDFQKELAKIAAESGQKIENGNVVPAIEPMQPQAVVQPEPQATTQPVQVPQKFQTPDGQVDLQKVQQSTVNAEAALERYRALEVELRQKQNVVHKLQEQPPQQSPQRPQTAPQYAPPPQQPQNPWQTFQPQLTPDVINQALAKSQNPGQILYETAQIMANDAAQRAYSQARMEAAQEYQNLSQRFESKERMTELQGIADRDPWVFSDEGIKALGAIRQSKPWLNNAPEPWLEAYKVYKADQVLSPISQVQTQTPTVGTAKVPPTPVQTANRTNQAPLSSETIARMSQAEINAMLDKMTPAQQQGFYRTFLPGAK